MRKLRTALIAGVVTLGVAGVAVTAAERVHVMNVDLPDGGVAQIHYIGDTAPQIRAPQIRVVQAPEGHTLVAVPLTGHPSEIADAAFADPFAQMDMMMAQIEQRHHAMMAQIAGMQQAATQASTAQQRGDGQAIMVSQGALPPGAVVQYSFTSSSIGATGCTQSVEWRSDGSGKQPEVVRASSGNCEGAERAPKVHPTADVAKSSVPAPKPAKPDVKEDQTHLLPGHST